MSNQKRIDQLNLELQVAVDEFNKIQSKIKELVVARDALKMKAFACTERLNELQGQEKISTEIPKETVN
jgi:septal ring factor EnvC (AmiA/AmiB activator)